MHPLPDQIHDFVLVLPGAILWVCMVQLWFAFCIGMKLS